MEKFRNKYRIASARAQWWDYGRNGLYFITICTANREHYFGKIVNGKMILSHFRLHHQQSCKLGQ
jgi:putative transposase